MTRKEIKKKIIKGTTWSDVMMDLNKATEKIKNKPAKSIMRKIQESGLARNPIFLNSSFFVVNGGFRKVKSVYSAGIFMFLNVFPLLFSIFNSLIFEFIMLIL